MWIPLLVTLIAISCTSSVSPTEPTRAIDPSQIERRLLQLTNQARQASGIELSRAGENIAQVTNIADPAVFAHDLLMDSERHRANILDGRFRRVGNGVAISGDTFWITQIFIRP